MAKCWNSLRYEGQFDGGKCHGQGTYFYANGNRYCTKYRRGHIFHSPPPPPPSPSPCINININTNINMNMNVSLEPMTIHNLEVEINPRVAVLHKPSRRYV